MRAPLLNECSFPTAQCEACERTVLTHVRLGADGIETRYCVHCDDAVGPEIEWVAADELEEQGYYFGSLPPAESACGGGGCGSCSTRRH